MGDVISRVGFEPLWLRLPGPGDQPQEGIFWKFHLWNLLIVINKLIRGLIKYFIVFEAITIEPKTLERK